MITKESSGGQIWPIDHTLWCELYWFHSYSFHFNLHIFFNYLRLLLPRCPYQVTHITQFYTMAKMIHEWRGQRLMSSRFKVQQIRSAKSLIDLLLASVTKRSSNQNYSSTDWGRVDKKKEIPRVGGSACVVGGGGGGSSSLVSELRSAGWAWQQLAHLSTTFTNTTWLNLHNPNVTQFHINRMI